MYVANTKALISCAVICSFVFTYAKSRFSHNIVGFNSIYLIMNTYVNIYEGCSRNTRKSSVTLFLLDAF